MYPITNEVKALFESEQRKVLRITGTDKNGTAINITDDNVMEDSFQIDRYSCNGEKLEIGTAIAAQLTLKLENGNGQYDGIVFEGAELFVEVGVADWTQENPTIHWVPCGYFTPDEQPRRLSTISITALDRMMRFDAVPMTLVPWTTRAGDIMTTRSGEPIYFVKSIRFPCTIAQIVAQAAELCNVPFTQDLSGFPNANINIAELPVQNKDITYRTLIQWCGAIMGCNAWIDWTGSLRFSWYENATDYVSTIDNRYSSDLYENDLSITGVAYTNNSGIQFVEGSADYTVDIVGNLLIGAQVVTMLPAIAAALNGFTYRPFTAAAVNAPYLWPMDIITFRDKDGNDHTSALTNVAFGLNGTTAMESKGMTYAINRGVQPSGFTKEQAQLVNEVKQSIVDLDDSLTQEEIFNRLTDGGAAQGIILYNGQLYVNASYIRTGTLIADLVKAGVLGDVAGKNYWNMETGEFSLSATATVGGSTVEDIAEQAVDEFDETLTQQDVFNRLTNNGEVQGIILSNGQLYINADYINTGMLSVGRIGFNDVEGHYQVPNENDPTSLLPGETISGGWIIGTDSYQDITLFNCDFAVPLRGQTITLTFTYKTRVTNGFRSYKTFESSDGAYVENSSFLFPETDPPYVPPNPYTLTYTVPNDAENLVFLVYGCDGVKNISVSVSGTPITPPTIKFDYAGLRIGNLLINRDGNVILDGYIHIDKPVYLSKVTLVEALLMSNGGTGGRTPAEARANIGSGCASGTFETADGYTVTVEDGFITDIS